MNSRVGIERVVLGVDPGSHMTGYGVIANRAGRLQVIAMGAIDGGKSKSLAERLLLMGEGLREVIRCYSPKEIAIEKSFYAKNADSALKLGHARGVCLYEAKRAGLHVAEYTPTEIKLSLTGNGRADKTQVGFMVKALLGIPTIAGLDISDALALAIHHARVSDTVMKMKEMEIT
jgi:crossover junction endodeoxyribonuclease RuvC